MNKKKSAPLGDNLTKLESGEKILRQAILSGRLRPGMKLIQQDLAREIGMSPTPVREIMRRLESEGLVEYIPRKGVYVSGVTAAQYQERIPIRASLERLAVELAVQSISEEKIEELRKIEQDFEESWKNQDLAGVQSANLHFHMTIYEEANSPVLLGLIRRLWPRFTTDLLWIVPGRTEHAIRDHNELIEAVEKGGADTAAELMWNHIMNSGKEILDYIDFQEENVSLKGFSLT